MQITFTVDTENVPELRNAAAVLAFLVEKQHSPRAEGVPERDISDIVAQVIPFRIRGHDQSGRLPYLHALATAGEEGLAVKEAVDRFFEEGGRQALGGTRSAVQRAWIKAGGAAYGPELISDFREGRQVMLAAAREAVEARSWQAMGEELRSIIRDLEPRQEDE